MKADTNLEKLIDCGPVILVKHFDTMLTDVDIESSKKVRYHKYLRLIESTNFGKTSASLSHFLIGHFIQSAGKNNADTNEKEKLFKQALIHYQSFLRLHKHSKKDALYYAQWQTAVLQNALGYTWPAVEESYLITLELDPERAEALRDILIYHCHLKNWQVALIYSTYCKTQFLGKHPLKRTWFINSSFYNWKILKYHIHILLNLGRTEEAETDIQTLTQHLQHKPNEFDQLERDEIAGLIESWERMLALK